MGRYCRCAANQDQKAGQQGTQDQYPKADDQHEPVHTRYPEEHEALEEELSSWLGTEDALLFSSGYAANVGTIAALAGRMAFFALSVSLFALSVSLFALPVSSCAFSSAFAFAGS